MCSQKITDAAYSISGVEGARKYSQTRLIARL
jgi:hypothetical protein